MRSPSSRFLPLFALMTLFGFGGTADAESLRRSERFERLAAADGLSQNEVYDILQDRRGYLWIGTDNGLNRWDGYEFRHYHHRRDDGSSLSENRIYSLLEDRRGRLWVGTVSGGLNRFDPETEEVRRYPADPSRTDGVSDALITDLVEDHEGRIWVGTYQGLDLYDPTIDGFRRYRHDPSDDATISDDRIRSLHVDRDGRVWAGTEDGLNLVDPNGRVTRHRFAGSEAVALRNHAVKVIHSDTSGALWLGTRAGLYRYDPQSGAREEWRRDGGPGRRIPFDDIWSIATDPGGRVWVGTNGGGLFRLNRGDGTIREFRYNPYFSGTLSDDRVKVLEFDRSGLLWIGTLGGGISVWNPRTAVFQSWRHEAGTPVARDLVRGVHATPQSLWIGTDAGLSIVDRRTTEERFVPLQGVVRCFVELGSATYLGTDSGLWVVPVAGGTPQPVGSVREVVLSVAGGRNGLWLGTDSGLLHVSEAGEVRRRFRHDAKTPSSLPDDQVNVVYVDDEENIWVGTRNGAALQRPDGTFRRYFYRDVALIEALHLGVVAIHRVGDVVWLGTDGEGLLRLTSFDGDAGIEKFGTEDGLLSDKVWGIISDREGRLWLTSPDGISRFDPARGDIRHFTEADGLPRGTLQPGALTQTPDGVVFAGTTEGVISFRPAEVRPNEQPPPVVITEVSRGDAREERQSFAERLVLRHDEPFLSVQFAALDYSRPAENRYRYRIAGLHDGWIDAGTKREVTFSGLPPGDYVFEVIGSNGDGVWSLEPAQLAFTVAPAPWRTRWAVAAYLMGALALIGLYVWTRGRKHAERRRVEKEIRQSEERLQLALWGSGNGMWDWDRASGRFYRSHVPQILQIRAEDLGETLEAQWRRIHPEDRPEVEAAWRAHQAAETQFYEAQFRMRAPEGWVTIHERGKAVERDAEGNATRINGTYRDITEQKHAQDELRLLAKAFENTSEGMIITDTRGVIHEVNAAVSGITGYDASEVEDNHIAVFCSARYSDDFFQRLANQVAASGQWKGEVWQRRKNGEEFPTFVNISVLRDVRGQLTHYVVVFSDITERKRAEEELRQLANYDVLTGLPNRTLFEDRLQHALAGVERNNLRLALLFIDLDRFKQINDSLGHACGDELLKVVAQRFRQCVRPSDTVARLGGDEFTVLVDSVSEITTVIGIADRLQAALSSPFHISGHEITITPSIGISLYPDDARDLAALMRNADTAMYHAKSQGRNNYQFFTDEMNAQVVERLVLENALRRAIKQSELLLHYQPRVDLFDGTITGIEALVRWNHPERGLLLPGRFIPIAEETEIIVEVGYWVFRRVCEQIREWDAEGLPRTRVAVNLSARQFRHQNLAETLKTILSETGVSASRIEIEITESTIMSDLEPSQQTLRELKEMGLYLSVDDFGTGYSALSYLKTFPIDALKIDRSFIRDITTDPQDAAIVSAITSLAEKLGLHVVGEGVEQREQLDYLVEQGCREAQGYYFSRPVEPGAMTELLRDGRITMTTPAIVAEDES